MLTPKARGSLSEALFATLTSSPAGSALEVPLPDSVDDAHIALWATHELHHRGLDDVDERWEWDPTLMGVRRALEDAFETTLRERWDGEFAEGDPVEALLALIEGHDGASLARHVQRTADREQVLEILRHRSIFHLKESDPTAWLVPRLETVPKAALMELLFDEYGNGDPNRLHHHLFAQALSEAGLSAEYGAYIDDVPVEVLEMNNAMTMFGLHRRLRGAALGHLAAFEASSSVPSRRTAQGMRRLGLPDAVAAYYDEHVEADAVHEQLAARVICGNLMAAEPGQVPQVMFGAFTCLDLDDRYARRVLADQDAA